MNNRLGPLWEIAILAVIAAGSAVNALWMLVAPRHWYEVVPGVADFGPFNEHFVRDIGCVYLTGGLALTWALFTRRWRFPLVAPVALFQGGHALLHVFDTARGHVSAHHWWLDLPTIHLPAVLLLAVAVSAGRTARLTRAEARS